MDRVRGRLRRTSAVSLARRPFRAELNRPVVSFTFDDFPKNAGTVGAAILEQLSVRGTYYVSTGLLGKAAPTGRIADAEDLPRLESAGHEIGCHTLDHHHAWETDAGTFARSLDSNLARIHNVLPSLQFHSMSYPISQPSPANKRAAGARFAGCRGAGQKPNGRIVDLNCLKAFFIEQAHGDLAPISDAIAAARRTNTWLIFATHDVDEHPSRYGCTPALLRAVVRAALESGAEVLPVAAVLQRIGALKAFTIAANRPFARQPVAS